MKNRTKVSWIVALIIVAIVFLYFGINAYIWPELRTDNYNYHNYNKPVVNTYLLKV
jgi:hypothetical protein